MNLTAKIAIRRAAPVVVILAVIATLYFTGVYRDLSYEELKQNHRALQQRVDDHPILSPLIYIVIYTAAMSLLIPGSSYFSILGGFLFPQPWCLLYAQIATMTGCTVVFLVARTSWGDLLHNRQHALFDRIQRGFQEDATSYLLAMRLWPLLPFWVSNTAPAIFHIPLWTYLWTTFVGLIPGRVIYTQAGRGLRAIFTSDEPLTLHTILNREMRIAIAALALFACLLILYRQIRKRQLKRRE